MQAMKKKTAPTKQARVSDERMRHDGYVTVQEAADALGMKYSGVRKAIESGRIPGKYVAGLGVYGRWYVDIRRLVSSYPTNGSPETRAALTRLAASVPRPPAA